MIVARGGDTLLLVITNENLQLLKRGYPILLDLASKGIGRDFSKIMIDWKPTMKEAEEKYRPLIGPETRIIGEEN